jgi:hypothetical protein
MAASKRKIFRLPDTDRLELYNLRADRVDYRSRRALRLLDIPAETTAQTSLAVLPGSWFRDGVITTRIAGAPQAGAPPEMRGFVGLAFHLQEDPLCFECFFIRPTNGRSEDQLRRNHATQYISVPDYPWYRLREENPGVYESYADLQPGAWTRMKIVVSGLRAQLYLNGASQPCLVVNDLKLGGQVGRIGLWVGAWTEAHFSTLTLEAASE